MTRAHAVRHRPGCTGHMSEPSHVGAWAIARCSECRATEVRRAAEAGTTHMTAHDAPKEH